MTDILLAAHMAPFTLALALLFGLLALELLAAVLGGTVLGLGGDADADLDVDLDLDMDADVAEAVDAIEATPGALAWLGLGNVPFLIWLGALLLAFGLGGFVLQTVLGNTVGALPAGLAAAIAAPFGIGFARKFSRLFARLLPKTETSAMSENHLGRRRGVISQGTAARGRPAEVRVYDRHGNMHYLRAEPLRDDQEFPQGTEVLVLRKSLTEGYRLIALTQ